MLHNNKILNKIIDKGTNAKRWDFVHVKTVVGLERFEVGKSRRSYEVLFSRGGGSQKLLQIGLKSGSE